MDETPKPNHDALKTRITSGGLFVAKLHYAADQFKNPENSVGKQWLRQALSGYPEGLEDVNWLKEMEIQYRAGSGQRLFRHWHEWQRSSNIFIDGDLDLSRSKLYGSYDHGYTTPACYLVHSIDDQGNRKTIWEFYKSAVPVHTIARVILGEDVELDSGEVIEGNPYAGREQFLVCDPEINRRNQQMAEGPNKSIIDLFRMHGVYFQAGERGDDLTVANWLLGNLWEDPQNPTYQIHARCKNLISELGRLQRKELSAMVARTKNTPEALVDKDNHAWDALKYWLKRFPVGAKTQVVKPKQADFSFWRDRKRSKVKQSYIRDFS